MNDFLKEEIIETLKKYRKETDKLEYYIQRYISVSSEYNRVFWEIDELLYLMIAKLDDISTLVADIYTLFYKYRKINNNDVDFMKVEKIIERQSKSYDELQLTFIEAKRKIAKHL